MRNPLARLVHRDPAKPTLRERAASLKASAARVIRRPKPVDAALSTDPLTVLTEIVGDDGMVSFEDNNGTPCRATVADWIAFAAQRMNGIARREASRQFNAARDSLDADAASALWDRLRREHRLDAIDALAFRWRNVFETAKHCAIGHVEYIAAADRQRLAGKAGADADLLAMGEARRVAQAAYDEAGERHDVLEALVERPEISPAMNYRHSDAALGLAKLAMKRGDGQSWYYVAAQPDGALRHPRFKDVRRDPRPEDNLPDDAMVVVERHPWPEAQARADEICAAFDRWNADRAAADEASGLTAVNDQLVAFSKELSRLDREIAAMTATTLAGLRVKVAVAQDHWEVDNDHLEIAASVYRDALALQDAPAVTGTGPQIDYGAASMERLRQLHEIVETVGELCDGFMSQTRCESVEGRFLAPGLFVDWLAGECDLVLDACRREAAHRRPLGEFDRRNRLAILARVVLDGDDENETAAFARDVQAVA